MPKECFQIWIRCIDNIVFDPIAKRNVAVEIEGPIIPVRVFEHHIAPVADRDRERLGTGLTGPAKLAPWLQSRKNLLLRARIRRGTVDFPGRFHLWGGQASRAVGTLALQNLRIEFAARGVFQDAVLHTVDVITRLQNGIVDERILAGGGM